MGTAGLGGHAARVRRHAVTGSAQPTTQIAVVHHRTPEVEWSIDSGTGGHMLHLALAQCVFNNLLRMAGDRGVTLGDVSVVADGGFDPQGTTSTGMECTIEVSGSAGDAELTALAEGAFLDSTVAAILRRGGPVELRAIRVVPQQDSRRAE
jgi:hypothetical protein